jgi:Tol biopolymer transport system component
MRRVTCAIACAAAASIVLAGCDGGNAVDATKVAVPSATVLSPATARHIQAKFSPDGLQVAYFTPGAGGYELMVAKADLGAPRRLATVRSPSPLFWSPDGTAMTYGGDAGTTATVVTLADGTVRRLTAGKTVEQAFGWHPRGDRVTYLNFGQGGFFGAMSVSIANGATAPMVSDTMPHIAYWSPDGTRIIYNRLQGGRLTLWIADSSGRNTKQLTTEGFEYLAGQQTPWSPDGSSIAYRSSRTGAGDIWVIPANGGAARQLTRDIRDDELPVWSPDGKWIAFRSTRGRQTDVWVVPVAGGEAIRVTDDPVEESEIQWIGDGLVIGFSRPTTSRSLWAVDMAGNGERQLTPDSIRIGEFRPSPVSDDVAYVVRRGGGVSELRLLSPKDGTNRSLVAGSSVVEDIAWSPDGKRIAFASDRSGNMDIWTVRSDGGQPTQLTTWPGFETQPEWSLDASSVYFTSDHESKLGDLWSVPVGGGPPRRLTTAGTINNRVAVAPNGELFLSVISATTGQLDVAKLTADGTLQVLWNRGNVYGISSRGFTPSGDSMAIVSTLPTGGQGTFFISTRTGEGRRVLGLNEFGEDLTPDGTQLVYNFGSTKRDYGILNLRDGTTRRLTNAQQTQSGYWLSYDGKVLLATRSVYQEGIVTVDLRATLAKKR